MRHLGKSSKSKISGDKDIKLQRTQSLLRELISEALSSLGNPTLNALNITSVVCSRGKHHAEVFIESSDLSAQDRGLILKELKRAEGVLREYVLSASGWFKCPKMTFKFDETLKSAQSLDQLFATIDKEREER